MASLLHLRTARRVPLTSELTIGRSSSCLLSLEDPRSSGHHAVLQWSGSQWELRDLGSRNGTWVDGRRIPPGTREPLQHGTKLAFGRDEDHWRVEGSGPPDLAAQHQQDWVEARGGLLALPSADAPEVVVYSDDQGGWLVERGMKLQQLPPSRLVEAAGLSWTVHLPSLLVQTAAATTGTSRSLENQELAFLVSQDEEDVELELRGDGPPLRIPHRAQHYLLLTLARARLEDADSPESERGWRYRDDLCRGLRIPENQFNVTIFRARQHLSKAGVLGAKRVVERRRGSAQLRLGCSRFVIEPL